MNPQRLASLLAPTIAAAAAIAVPLAAQSCSNQGSTPVAALLEAGPVALGCAGAPTWPCWHLFTPRHRAPAPHAGFDPGNAVALPRILVSWHCTGWLLVPVLPAGVTTMGYVVDRPEYACSTTGN
jgi:hypothetical protein